MEARLAGTGSLSQLASEPGDPVGKSVPGRGEWLGAKWEGGRGQRMLGTRRSFLTSPGGEEAEGESTVSAGFSLGGPPGRGRVRKGRLELYCGGKKLLVDTRGCVWGCRGSEVEP